MSELAAIDKVRALEAAALRGPQVRLDMEMFAHAGLGARTILIPAGQTLTGALTKLDNVCISSGDITVTTDEGAVRLTGYHVVKALAGSKRAGYAHADTWWTTLWRTDETDPRAMEDEMTDESEMLQNRRAGIEFAQPIELGD